MALSAKTSGILLETGLVLLTGCLFYGLYIVLFPPLLQSFWADSHVGYDFSTKVGTALAGQFVTILLASCCVLILALMAILGRLAPAGLTAAYTVFLAGTLFVLPGVLHFSLGQGAVAGIIGALVASWRAGHGKSWRVIPLIAMVVTALLLFRPRLFAPIDALAPAVEWTGFCLAVAASGLLVAIVGASSAPEAPGEKGLHWGLALGACAAILILTGLIGAAAEKLKQVADSSSLLWALGLKEEPKSAAMLWAIGIPIARLAAFAGSAAGRRPEKQGPSYGRLFGLSMLLFVLIGPLVWPVLSRLELDR